MVLPFAAGCGDGGSKNKASPSPCPTVSASPGASPASASPTASGTCYATETQSGTARDGQGSYKFTLTQPIPQAGGTQIQTADLEIRLTSDGDKVHGTIEGPTRQQLTQPSCPSNTVAPGKTTAQLEGTRTDEVLELHVVSASWQRPQVEPCPTGGLPNLLGETTVSGIEGFDDSLSRLQRGADGVYRMNRTDTVGGPAPFTLEYHVEVHF